MLLTGCVSPRSLDGLVRNSRNKPEYKNNQSVPITKVKDRLEYPTVFEDFGWKRIISIPKLFEEYSRINTEIKPDKIKLESIEVCHPKLASKGSKTFNYALKNGMLIMIMVYKNTLKPFAGEESENSPHAVTIYQNDQNEFVIKNSDFNEKRIRIHQNLPIYEQYQGILGSTHKTFLGDARKIVPNFDETNWILSGFGYAFEFKDMPQFLKPKLLV